MQEKFDLRRALDVSFPTWRSEIDGLGQAALVRARASGRRATDAEAVQALFLAYLSAMTDWRRIESSRDVLLSVFADWKPAAVARLRPAKLRAVHGELVGRRLGSVLLRQQLAWLPLAARKMERMATVADSVDAFLSTKTQDERVRVLADPTSEWKLPGVGVALAAEFLKNLGFDDFKPDRHTIRILGPTRLGLISSSDPHAVRRLGIALANDLSVLATELDQMLWMYCARGYANICGATPKCSDCTLASRCRYPRRQAEP